MRRRKLIEEEDTFYDDWSRPSRSAPVKKESPFEEDIIVKNSGLEKMSENNNIDPIFDYIGKIVQIRHNDRQYSAKLIAIKGDELWLEAKNKQRWMVSRSVLQYLGLVGNQVA
jgi:hypothetical protein